MHSCAITGLCFCLWATACAAGAASTAVHVTAILTIGFFVAGPGGVLGASARGLVGYAGRAKEGALVAAVAGLVNGSGSVGAVVQGLLTTQILEYSGWAGLFGARERSPLPPYEAPNHASHAPHMFTLAIEITIIHHAHSCILLWSSSCISQSNFPNRFRECGAPLSVGLAMVGSAVSLAPAVAIEAAALRKKAA